MKNPKALIYVITFCLLFMTFSYSKKSTDVSDRKLTKAPTVSVFVDVNVVPMDSERILERQTVLVREGQIEVVGPVSEVQVPDDEKTTAEGIIPVRVYEMEVSSKSFPHKSIIFLDNEGYLHELHLRSQEGFFKFVRLE